jgi:hypothetical protein
MSAVTASKNSTILRNFAQVRRRLFSFGCGVSLVIRWVDRECSARPASSAPRGRHKDRRRRQPNRARAFWTKARQEHPCLIQRLIRDAFKRRRDSIPRGFRPLGGSWSGPLSIVELIPLVGNERRGTLRSRRGYHRNSGTRSLGECLAEVVQTNPRRSRTRADG